MMVSVWVKNLAFYATSIFTLKNKYDIPETMPDNPKDYVLRSQKLSVTVPKIMPDNRQASFLVTFHRALARLGSAYIWYQADGCKNCPIN